jgi:ribonuclease P protein subunit POP4
MASDPIFTPSPGFKDTVSSSSNTTTFNLLQKAFPSTAIVQQIYKQKLEHRPLNLNPTDAVDARESRRQKRSEKLKRKRKPKPLSAKEKRELRIHDLSKEDIKLVLFF